jgi:hypothetical protein
METLTLKRSYPVFCWQGGNKVLLGNVAANSLQHANTKAQQLFNRHAFAERVDTPS